MTNMLRRWAFGSFLVSSSQGVRARVLLATDESAGDEDVPTLTSVSADITDLSAKIQSLNNELSGVQANITSLETVTAAGLKDLSGLDRDIAAAAKLSSDNAQKATVLQGSAKQISEKLTNNTATLKTLEKYLGTLGENVLVLEGAGKDTATRVSSLERMVNDTVPTGQLRKDMDAVESRVGEFETKLAKGVQGEIRSFLKKSVDGMRGEVRALGRAVAQSKANGDPLPNSGLG